MRKRMWCVCRQAKKKNGEQQNTMYQLENTNYMMNTVPNARQANGSHSCLPVAIAVDPIVLRRRRRLPSVGRRFVVVLALRPFAERHLHRLRLVARQLDVATHILRDRSLEAALAQQRIDRFDVIPSFLEV